MEYTIWGWAGFVAFLLIMLALDLGVFHRKSHVVGFREAVVWSCIWAAMAVGFGWLLLMKSGPETATEFVTAWVIEKSLSIDNVFVFALLFTSMRVPRHCEHKVLFWGVFGALLMRVVMIFSGIALMERFEWLIYLFGGCLLVASIRMLLPVSDKSRQQEHVLMRLSRRYLRLTPDYEGDRFFVRRNHVLYATPLFVVLLVVEWSDLVFAVDSIPAVLAVSRDPFIVFTSNAFAILGLRSLYFALAGMMESFRLLHYGLAAILGFVGLKMILVDVYHVPVIVSLCVILTILILSVLLSLGRPWRITATEHQKLLE